MPSWTSSKEIRQAVLRQWENGNLLRHALLQDDFFPLRIKLTGPTAAEVGTHFSQLIDWVSQLKKEEKSTLGYGYTLIEREFHHRVCGKNSIPTYIEFSSPTDAVRLIKKQAELALFEQTAAALLQEWSCLQAWILKNPFTVLKLGDRYSGVLLVLRWFSTHDHCDLYLRQLDIEGVDTKFIENNKTVIAQLLDLILPLERVNKHTTHFEKRYGLKSKAILVRFRILDAAFAQNGCTDISLPREQFEQLALPVQRCFITENEINFLSFPAVPNACILFGKGYGIDLFREVLWLKDKDVFYWGDIDTHGFNILGMARGFLPQIHSFLMTQQVLLAHRPLWSVEEKQHTTPIENLTEVEFDLACHLQSNTWGQGVRLEQERIRFSEVESFIRTVLDD